MLNLHVVQTILPYELIQILRYFIHISPSKIAIILNVAFLDQVRASHRLAHAWFLKIDPVWIIDMYVCVCVHAQGY